MNVSAEGFAGWYTQMRAGLALQGGNWSEWDVAFGTVPAEQHPWDTPASNKDLAQYLSFVYELNRQLAADLIQTSSLAGWISAIFQGEGGNGENGSEGEYPGLDNLAPESPLADPENRPWEDAIEPLKPGEFILPGSPWQYSLLEPGPLPESIARNFAGGQYSVMTVGGEGWSFDAVYRVWGVKRGKTAAGILQCRRLEGFRVR